MAKYRKRPVVIEATQWFGFDKGPHDLGIVPLNPASNKGYITTLEGGHEVTPGDWIITGVQGEKYPCKPDIFEQTYEPVTQESTHGQEKEKDHNEEIKRG